MFFVSKIISNNRRKNDRLVSGDRRSDRKNAIFIYAPKVEIQSKYSFGQMHGLTPLAGDWGYAGRKISFGQRF